MPDKKIQIKQTNEKVKEQVAQRRREKYLGRTGEIWDKPWRMKKMMSEREGKNIPCKGRALADSGGGDSCAEEGSWQEMQVEWKAGLVWEGCVYHS